MKRAKNFQIKEFTCPHCKVTLIAYKLLDGLQQLRDKIEKPIVINSGFRCNEYNKAKGGVINSRHLYGDAADIRVPGMSSTQLKVKVEQIPVFEGGGIGLYRTYVHVDTRGVKARWERR